jgi:hypothetical protein
VKTTKWFWNAKVGPWTCWGIWWRQCVFIGVSVCVDMREEAS